ncbi:MAG: DMT family transporter [Paracoccaceae bacterium]
MPPIPTRVLEAGLVLAWSSGFVGAVLASEAGAIFSVLFWRFALAAALVAPFALGTLARQPLGTLAGVALSGALAMFGYLACVIAAVDLGVPPATAAIVTSLQPLATAALAGPVLGERVGLGQIAGLGRGLSGVTLAVGGSAAPAPMLGYALAGLATASIVAASLLAKRAGGGAREGLGLLPTLCLQCAVSATLFLPLAYLQGALVPMPDRAFVEAVVWFVALSTFGAYGLYWACLARTTATRTASLMYLTPPVTGLWAWAMFGEAIEPAAVAGFAVCLAGVVLAARPRAAALRG